MDVVDLARWQFGITTVYHFMMVPLTIGLGLVVATLQTMWHRTGKDQYLRMTKFWGKLFLINFALGVVTGIVQEFQFGMNWSDYSRFVGDIFGAPLAIEALLAFFLESTFLGLWLFGWGRIPEKLHAACIWLVHIGTMLSAYFILAANSFMQHPVGYRINPDTGRAELVLSTVNERRLGRAGRALQFFDPFLDIVQIDHRDALESGRISAAELGEPVVVDAQHLERRLGIVQPAARAQHAVQDLGLHAVAVLVLDAQLGIGEPAEGDGDCRPATR